jgi:hypothetical protein
MGDKESPILEIPMKAQVIATYDIVQHIPCRPANREVYASTDWGNGYITNVGTSIWDPSSIDTSGVNAQDKIKREKNDTVVQYGIQVTIHDFHWHKQANFTLTAW